MGGPFLTMLVNFLMFIAYDSAYALSKDTDVAKAALGAAVFATVETDIFYASIHETANAIVIWKSMEDWKAGQWTNLSPA